MSTTVRRSVALLSEDGNTTIPHVTQNANLNTLTELAYALNDMNAIQPYTAIRRRVTTTVTTSIDL